MVNFSTYMHCRAIRESRVPPPSDPLVRREFSRPLAFKEEDRFSESISVVVTGKARMVKVVVLVGREGIAEEQSSGEEEQKCERWKMESHLETAQSNANPTNQPTNQQAKLQLQTAV